MTSFYTDEELSTLGFSSIGENLQISRFARFYGTSRISIGNNVRIDDFCVLSAGKGGIQIGNYVHIAVYTSLMGDGKITLSDFSGLSSRVAIYSSNDDYSGMFMTNPTLPSEYTNVDSADVTIEKHVIIGSGSIVLPGVKLEEGVAVGALSLITKNCKAFTIYSGNPARALGPRSEKLLEIEKQLNSKNRND